MIKDDLDKVIDYLLKHRGVDFSGYSRSMVERQFEQRMNGTNNGTIPEYFEYIKSHPDELDYLIDNLIINVSSFFRDPLVFNYLFTKILPKLLFQKETSKKPSLRVWSAGCAAGEEPYSVALEINTLLKNLTTDLIVNIFATDIDKVSIDKACKAMYKSKSLNNIRFEYLKHFTQKADTFSLKHKIKKLVNFSKYDLLDKKSYCPPESVYGDFDIVLCRNVLIYYNTQYQNRILTKLYQSLNGNGYLVLGETETLTGRFHDKFRKVNDCCHIYKKK